MALHTTETRARELLGASTRANRDLEEFDELVEPSVVSGVPGKRTTAAVDAPGDDTMMTAGPDRAVRIDRYGDGAVAEGGLTAALGLFA